MLNLEHRQSLCSFIFLNILYKSINILTLRTEKFRIIEVNIDLTHIKAITNKNKCIKVEEDIQAKYY